MHLSLAIVLRSAPVLAALCAATALARAADDVGVAGWTDPVFAQAVDGCTQAIIDAQRKQFLAGAADQGMADAQQAWAGFEAASRRTFAPVCSCVVKAWSARQSPAQVLADRDRTVERAAPLLEPGASCAADGADLQQELRRHLAEVRPQAPLQQALRRFREASSQFCADPAYAAYFARTACSPDGLTVQQLADAGRAAPQDQPLLRRVQAAIDARLGDFIDAQRAYGGESGAAIAAAYLQARTAIDGSLQRLIRGETTWGEYNRERVRIGEALKAGLAGAGS